MDGSLVPANTKRSTLVLGMYRWAPDILILGIGVTTTILLLIIFNNAGSLIMIISCIPMLIGAFLTLPIPNYHNVLCALQSIISFYNNRRKYIWRGWCNKIEYKEDKQ